VKPVVAFDIDGTLGDYHGHFIEFAEGYLGVQRDSWKIHPYTGGENFGSWFCSMYLVPRDEYRKIKLAYRQGGMKRTMPVYHGAVKCVSQFHPSCEVWLTTTRPYLRLDSVDPDTRAWLHRHRIYYDNLMYAEDKYERLAELVDKERVIAVLDDLPEMYDAAARLFGTKVPILRHTTYNKAARPKVNGVLNLDEARMAIIERYKEWVRLNG